MILIHIFFFLPDKSPKFKELYVIFLALTHPQELFSLIYSNSVYAVNLLPWLARSYIKLDGNHFSPTTNKSAKHTPNKKMSQFVHHVWSHSYLPGFPL